MTNDERKTHGNQVGQRDPAYNPLRYLCLVLALQILRHPWRFLLLVATVSFLGWLSGYDVR
jgi:hypothetical protein